MSVHQPSKEVFQSFDRVVFLSAAHVVFEGERLAASAWFRQLGYNVPKSKAEDADFYLALINCPRPEKEAEEEEGEKEKEKEKEQECTAAATHRRADYGKDATSQHPGDLEAGAGLKTMTSITVVRECSVRFREFQRRRSAAVATTAVESSRSIQNSQPPSPPPPPPPSVSPPSSPPSPLPSPLPISSHPTLPRCPAQTETEEAGARLIAPAPKKWLAPWLYQIPRLALREVRFNYRNVASVGYYSVASFILLVFLGIIVSGATFEGDAKDFTLLASKQITKMASLVIIVFATLPPLLVQEWDHHQLTTKASILEIEDGRVSALALAVAEETVYIVILATTCVVSSMVPYYLSGLAGSVGSVAWGKFVLVMFLVVWDM